MAKDEYICPKCGSNNKEFPNPIRPSASGINMPEMVNNLWECSDCGYIGVFFIRDINYKKASKKAKK